MSARLSAEADALCGLDEFTGVWALDGTTFQASDTEENRKEWPYASGQKPGCGFPVVGAMVAHSLIGKGSSVLVTPPWNAHDFRLYVEASGRFKAGELEKRKRENCMRAVKRRLKPYPLLTKPRSEYRPEEVI